MLLIFSQKKSEQPNRLNQVKEQVERCVIALWYRFVLLLDLARKEFSTI